MANKIRTAIRVASLISLLASISVILVSIWTFGSILHSDSVWSHLPDDAASIDTKGTHTISKTYGTENISLWIKFGPMTGNFKAMMVGCSWMTLIFGFVQLCTNLPLLFGSSKVLQSFPTYTLGAHFICMLFMVGCFFIPLTYNRDCPEGTREEICTKQLSIEDFYEKMKIAFSTTSANFLQFLCDDLTSYYAFVGYDIFILLSNVTFLACVLHYGNDYSIHFDSV